MPKNQATPVLPNRSSIIIQHQPDFESMVCGKLTLPTSPCDCASKIVQCTEQTFRFLFLPILVVPIKGRTLLVLDWLILQYFWDTAFWSSRNLNFTYQSVPRCLKCIYSFIPVVSINTENVCRPFISRYLVLFHVARFLAIPRSKIQI